MENPATVPQLSLHSPVGDLTVSEEEDAIVAVDWGWGRDQTPTPLLRRVIDHLNAYFDGQELPADLPLAPAGSLYRQKVWAVLRKIPHGQTRTYGEIAAVIGGAARSVGQANGANPIPILIPCHRVVAAGSRHRFVASGNRHRFVASGNIGGYSGGDGVDTKRWLLGLESPDLLHAASTSRARRHA